MNTESTITPRWLKLSDAAKYASIGEKRLVSLAAQRKIKAFQDLDDARKPWIFDRISIDAYRESQSGAATLDLARIQQYVTRMEETNGRTRKHRG